VTEASTQAGTGINDNFSGDACTSSSFCMAVGNYGSNGRAVGLAERLTGGGSWVVTAPVVSPPHGWNVFANEVACASPASCLFVGSHWAGQTGPSANLAEFWNGTSWQIVTAPAPVPKGIAGLTDVACPTTKFCLVTGQAGLSGRGQAAAYTWTNGTKWARISVPHPRGALNSELGGLGCFNASNCMAVGDYQKRLGHSIPFAARWHNGRWQLLTTPSVPGQRLTEFQAVSCPAATLCVAAGETVENTRHSFVHAFAEVWSGAKWRVSTLRKAPSQFLGISCPARNRCFAAGVTFPSSTAYAHALVETWNGRTWTAQRPVETAAPRAGDVMYHVACVNRATCEAVGFRFNPKSNAEATVAEKWNGHRWALQTTVNP